MQMPRINMLEYWQKCYLYQRSIIQKASLLHHPFKIIELTREHLRTTHNGERTLWSVCEAYAL